MGYEEFKRALLEELQGFYGKDAVVGLRRMREKNGQGYDGLWIVLAEGGGCTGLVLGLDSLYEEHGKDGAAGLDACMEAAISAVEEHAGSEEARGFIGQLTEWEAIRGMVRPILANAGWNRGLLEGLAWTPLLDLAVTYAIQEEEGRYSTDVLEGMLEHYGIGLEELHGQALANMEKDGYRFLGATDALRESACGGVGEDRGLDDRAELLEMYVLTNQKMEYGAAGLLQDRLLREFADGRSFYILPVTIDVAIFIPDYGLWDEAGLDRIMQTVNQKVDVRKRLSDHCYYYDGVKDVIRISKRTGMAR